MLKIRKRKKGMMFMAYMGRGGFPPIGGNGIGGSGDNNGNNNGFYHRGPFWYRRFYYYVPLDNTYVIMQMIVTFIIMIVGAITFISTYKSDIVDPIESTKAIFLNGHLIIIGILLVLSFIVNYTSKNSQSLIKRLVILAGVSIIMLFVFLGVKANLDTTYNKEKFEQFYVEQKTEDTSSKKSITNSKLDVSITGISLKTEQEHYVDECTKLYGIFNAKSYGTFALHLLFIGMLIFQILKVIKINGKKEQLSKDDAILFDEEENIKF